MIERAAAGGWEIVTSSCGGCTAAVAGTEVHVEFGGGLVLNRRTVREFLRPLFDRMGMLTTRTPVGDEASSRFVSRLGFRKTWGDDAFDYYSMTALPFSKEQ